MAEFEWDAEKDAQNVVKHGISFDEAATIFDGDHIAAEPAPTLGGDTADLLTARLGMSAADITRLTDAKTIAC